MTNLFEVSGISLDNTIEILYGIITPGTAPDTIAAPQGSVYFDTSGSTWKKIADGSGLNKWSKTDGVSSINSFPNVSGRTVIDSLTSSEVDTVVWVITVFKSLEPANRQTVILTGSHNGVTAQSTIFSKLDFGTKIPGLTYEVMVENGFFDLVITSTPMISVECYRLNTITNGTTVTLGGGGGGVDITPQLNAEIAARIAADNALLAAINTGTATNYNFVVDVIGSPVSGALVGEYVAPSSFDLSGTGIAKALVAATSQAVFTLKKNDINLGTITFEAGSTIGLVSLPPTSLVSGDVLTLFAPSLTDATLSNIAITIVGSGASSGGTSTPQVNSDWNATSGVAQILNKPNISAELPKLPIQGITSGALIPSSGTYLGRLTESEHQWLGVNLVSGVSVNLSIFGNDDGFGTLPAPTFRVRNATGSDIPFVSDAGVFSTEGYFIPPTTGKYYLDVSDKYTGYGTYQVKVSQGQNPILSYSVPFDVNTSTTIMVDTSVDMTLSAGVNQWISTELTQDTNLNIFVLGLAAMREYNLPYPRLGVFDSTGTLVAYSTTAFLYFTPSVSGTYYLNVTEVNNSSGTYQAAVYLA